MGVGTDWRVLIGGCLGAAFLRDGRTSSTVRRPFRAAATASVAVGDRRAAAWPLSVPICAAALPPAELPRAELPVASVVGAAVRWTEALTPAGNATDRRE